MPRFTPRAHVIALVGVLGLGLASCDDPEPTPTATTPDEVTATPTSAAGQPASPIPTPSPTPPPLPESIISVGPIDPPLSQAEIRVGEIIIEFDGRVTDEGTVLTLEEPILFDFDSSRLKSAASDALDDVAEVLDFYEDAPVIVEGHTDSVGTTDYNLNLSQERADAVTDALEDRGIPASRMTAEGRGESEPVAPNEDDDGSDNPDGRARNRRVEVLVVGVEPPS